MLPIFLSRFLLIFCLSFLSHAASRNVEELFNFDFSGFDYKKHQYQVLENKEQTVYEKNIESYTIRIFPYFSHIEAINKDSVQLFSFYPNSPNNIFIAEFPRRHHRELIQRLSLEVQRTQSEAIYSSGLILGQEFFYKVLQHGLENNWLAQSIVEELFSIDALPGFSYWIEQLQFEIQKNINASDFTLVDYLLNKGGIQRLERLPEAIRAEIVYHLIQAISVPLACHAKTADYEAIIHPLLQLIDVKNSYYLNALDDSFHYLAAKNLDAALKLIWSEYASAVDDKEHLAIIGSRFDSFIFMLSQAKTNFAFGNPTQAFEKAIMHLENLQKKQAAIGAKVFEKIEWPLKFNLAIFINVIREIKEYLDSEHSKFIEKLK